jgi:hypothetical protein
MLSCLLTRAEFARTLACYVPKDASERSEAVPASLERDLGHRQVGVPQERLCPFDAARQQIAVRRNSEGILERSGKVRLGSPAHPREALDRPFLMRCGVHRVFRAQQAAQQLRVLVGLP